VITPRLDQRGRSIVHTADVRVLLSWALIATLTASLSGDPRYLLFTAVAGVVVYLVGINGKTTPAPPLLRLVLGGAALLWTFNIMFAGSSVGRWSSEAPVAVAGPWRAANESALRLLSTGMPLGVLLIALAPRRLARVIDRAGATSAVSEGAALVLRSLAVIEIDIRVILRAWVLQSAGHKRSIPRLWESLAGLVVTILVSSLERARQASRSLWIHGVSMDGRRLGYRDSSRTSSNRLLMSLLILYVVLFMFTDIRH
jgi:energy-coupling factor transporter transmembrane protein EcfT